MPSLADTSTNLHRGTRSLKQRWLRYLPGLVVLAYLFAGGPAAADAAFAPPEQGMYENCSPSESECLTRLDELHQMGITVVINYWAWQGTDAEITAYADHAQALGMKLIWPTFQGSDTDLAKAIALVRDHPATWGYYIGEEAFTSDQAAAVHAYSQKVHALDPSHPRLYVGWGMSELQPTLGPFARDAEVLGADFYPVGVGVPIGRTASFASELTRVARSRDRQSATVLQAFNWASEPTLAPPGAHRWPTVDEMRRMRNLSYLAGDSGLMLWFDYYFIKPLGTTDMRHADALSKALAAPYPAKVGGLEMKRRALRWNQSGSAPLTVSCRQHGHSAKSQLWGNRPRFRINRACRGSGAATVRVRTSAKRTLSSTTRSLSLRIGGKGRVRTLHQ